MKSILTYTLWTAYRKLLYLLFSIFLLSACHNKASAPFHLTDDSYQKKVDSLIQQAAPFYHSGRDSLNILAEKLILLATTHRDTINLIRGKMWKAGYELRNSNYPMVMKNALAALDLAEAKHARRFLPDIYSLMGNAYKENEYYKEAIPMAQKALQAARSLKDTPLIIGAFLDYGMFTHSYSMKENNDSIAKVSLGIYEKGLHLAQNTSGNEALEIAFLDDISQYYKLKGDYEKGIRYGKKGAALAHRFNRKRSLTYSLNWLGEMYYDQGQQQQGLLYLDSALAYARELKWPFRIAEIMGSKYECYQSSGHFKAALKNFVRSQSIRDSLQMLKNVRQVGLLQVQYETGKKEQKITMLGQLNQEKTKEVGIFLVIIILFLALAVFLALQYRAIRHRNRLLKDSYDKINKQSEKLNLLMKELHHRVKNNLQIVSGLLSLQSNHLDDKDAMQALQTGQQRVEAMALIHRSLYEQDLPNQVDMPTFLRELCDNLLESFDLKDKVRVKVDIRIENMDVDMAMPLGLIINEWGTNILKYAYEDVSHPQLEFSLIKAQQIRLEIKDNGSGIDRKVWENPQGSFGIKLIKVLVKQLEGTLEMDNGCGTTIRVCIPDKRV